MEERTIAQQATFKLKKQGYKATRITEKVIIDTSKNGIPIYETTLVSFGYSKEKGIPKEILLTDVEKYDFIFIYEN